MYNSVGHFRTESRLCCVGSALYQPLIESYNLLPPREPPQGATTAPLGWRRSRVVTFTAIRLRGPGFKFRPGQKFENENVCFRRTPAMLMACHLCRMRPIKTPLYKTRMPILFYKDVLRPYSSRRLPVEKSSANKDFRRSVIMIASE